MVLSYCMRTHFCSIFAHVRPTQKRSELKLELDEAVKMLAEFESNPLLGTLAPKHSHRAPLSHRSQGECGVRAG